MKQKRNGFTMMEIMLFLAVTALLLIGVLGMTHNSIRDQRFNDSVQSFAEFLRRVYSEVANPQSIGEGRSEYAIYGKLVTFGENTDLSGKSISGRQEFFVYDVVGDSVGTGTGDTAAMLRSVNANVVIITKKADGSSQINPAGVVESYVPTWESAIDTTKNGEPFVGSILIVRHPRSGTITTLVSKNVVNVNYAIKTATAENIKKLLVNRLGSASADDKFEIKEVDFCVNSEGYGLKSGDRRNVRLTKNARNASGVEIIESDNSDNRCK